jgi:enoyl-CoA hydratase
MLEEQCPFSTHVTHRSIGLSKDRSLRECFLQDFILAQHFSVNQNFSEGVRCLLIDKGATPKFTHKHLLDVKAEEVDAVLKAPKDAVDLGI